jgi:RNA polymerase sigma factor (sigma-70 family)
MAEANPNLFVHQIRQLIGGDPAQALSDRQLLERFLSDRDETAVEVLVRRYGPLVLGVCRRVLQNADAAEDAFQAAFLVLVRKAPSLVCCERLGGFLYRVAYRLALRTRLNEARRRQREFQAARDRAQRESRHAAESELIVVLEEELQKLPEKHRVPLVLRYLEGKTNDEAAHIVGCPRGTMAARLEQARDRLRECLARRGYCVGAGGIAAVLSGSTAQAVVPLPLVRNTVRAAIWFASEQTAHTGVVSAAAVALAREACRTMLLNKVKLAAAVLLLIVLLGTGTTILLRAAPSPGPAAPGPGQPVVEARGERLPEGALARMGTTRLRHGDAVFFTACTPDGNAMVTAGRDRTVRLWHLATGKEIRRFDWPEEKPDTAAEPSEDGITQRWQQQLWDDFALSCQAALSPDGKTVAASRRGAVCLWETSTGKKLRQLQTGLKRLDQLSFSPDGKRLLTLGPGHAAAVWEVATGKCRWHHEGKPVGRFRVSEYAAVMEQIAVVSPGWKYLAFREQADNDGLWSIKIKELVTGKVVTQIHTGDGRAPLTFTADERTLVWGPFKGGIVFSDVATGKELRRLGDGTRRYVMATNFAFSPDGKSLAIVREDHTIELWDLVSGKQTGRFAPPARRPGDQVGALVRPALAFAPDGKSLWCSLGGAVLRQFRADTSAEISGTNTGPMAPVSTLGLSADGKSLWGHGSGEVVRCWDTATGKEIGRREVPGSATHAVFTPDGRLAYADGKTLSLCDAGGKQTRKIPAPELPLVALAQSPDGTVLATRSHYDLGVYLWDAQLKQRRALGSAADLRGSNTNVLSETTGVVTPEVVFSPDGRCLAGAGPRRRLCLWDVKSGNFLRELPCESQVIERFTFSPSGQCLATVNADATITLYDALTGSRRGQLDEIDRKKGRLHLTFSFNQGSGLLATRWHVPVCLAFSPDGQYLATAKDTPAIHIWDVLSGRKVGRLEGHEGGVVSLLFSADGKRLFSGGMDTTVLSWDLTGRIKPRPAHATRLPGQTVESLWGDLAGDDAARAFAATRRLAACPDQAVTLIKQRVRPATIPDSNRVAQLVADLRSDGFESRRRAMAKLEELGELAEPALRLALADDPPLSVRQRLERLLNLMGNVSPGGKLRELRSVEVLEMIGNPQARQVLESLAVGAANARLTRQASSALHRLGSIGE